jgi:hypothetical protein
MSTLSDRLPNFLIVGAMKAGTSSLYRDLLAQREIFLPSDKEPHCLVSEDVLTEAGLRNYAKHFRRASSHQICGEASTGYTKLPDFVGVPQRALRVLGPETKIIYLVRAPIERIRSHHYHDFSEGNAPRSIDEALEIMPSLIHYSRYAMQIQPWIHEFGRPQVQIIEFERFVRDRAKIVCEICEWLGVKGDVERISLDTTFNKTEGKPICTGVVGRFNQTLTYRRLIRPLLSPDWRYRIRSLVLPKAPPRPDPPSTQSIAYIRAEISDDLQALCDLMGDTAPDWASDVTAK